MKVLIFFFKEISMRYKLTGASLTHATHKDRMSYSSYHGENILYIKITTQVQIQRISQQYMSWNKMAFVCVGSMCSSTANGKRGIIDQV